MTFPKLSFNFKAQGFSGNPVENKPIVNRSLFGEDSVDDRVNGAAKITFEKIVLGKDDQVTRNLKGSVSLTRDDNHTGWLHILIYIGQIINAIFTGRDLRNVNLCHGQVILGVNKAPGKENHLILAHGLFDGIKTTSEDHKTDKIITSVNIYLPVDEKMRNLFVKFAEQTAANFKKEGIDPKAPDFKEQLKRKVAPFSIPDLLLSFFHKQEIKPSEEQRKKAAFAAADLLKGDKLRDASGNFASYYCTAYMMTLLQGTSLVSALSNQELESLSKLSREEIADHLFKRMEMKKEGDFLAATYWENEFMQADARYTMSYFAGDLLDRASAAPAA